MAKPETTTRAEWADADAAPQQVTGTMPAAPSPRADAAAIAGVVSVPIEAPQRAQGVGQMASDSTVVAAVADDVADEVMAATSPEGRPPKAALRRFEWWVVGLVMVVMAVIAIGAGVWLGLPPIGIIGMGVGAAVLFGLGAWPVWSAGLLRGGEERAIRGEKVE